MLTSPRLRLRQLCLDASDRAFIATLLSDPDFIANIGDKKVRSDADAGRYIEQGPRASFARHGFGLRVVESRGEGRPLGICGLVRRDTLPYPDLGFAFLPEHRGHGYAHEASVASLEEARQRLELPTVAAITRPENRACIRVLAKLGMRAIGRARLGDEAHEVLLFHLDLR